MLTNFTLDRKHRWREHYFFRMVLWKFSEITNNKAIFSQCSIFYNYEYLFFQSTFWSVFNHHQRSQSNQKQCSLCCGLPCFRVLLCTHYGPLQCFSAYPPNQFLRLGLEFNHSSSPPEVFLEKDVLITCSKFTRENPCRGVISIKLFCNFIEITLWHGCSPVHLLHIFPEIIC